MSSESFAMSESEALAVAGRIGTLRIAVATPRGPLLRTLDGVVHQGALCFHAGDHGEKLDLLGREAMVAVDEVVAHLPSWFFDERRACPATTYYRSVHAWGRVERVEEGADKAAILQALMERYQPEGRHEPLDARAPIYAEAVRKLLVARVRPVRIVGKAKLGQHKGARTIIRALEGLWRRGEPGDLSALRIIREAHPARPTLPWMRGPGDVTFELSPDEREVKGAVTLVEGEYWNEGVEPSRIVAAHLASPAWVVGKDERGRVVATARAISDDAKAAMIYDVAIHRDRRGEGLGQALMTVLLDHPRLRRARRVLLQTRDAQSFYGKLGFARHSSRNELMAMHPASELG